MKIDLTRDQVQALSRAAHLSLENLLVTDKEETALIEARKALYKALGIEQVLWEGIKPGDLVQVLNSRIGGMPGPMYVVKVYKKSLKVAYPDVYENYQVNGGELWVSTYSKSNVQRFLATKEDLEEGFTV